MEAEEKLRIIRTQLLEAERDLETKKQEKRDVLEEIRLAQEKLKDLKPLKERAKGEYKEVVGEVIDKNRRTEEIKGNIRIIKLSEVKILEKLEAEIKEKTRILNSFKGRKKDFIGSLDKREEDLNKKEKDLEEKSKDIDKKNKELANKEERLKREGILLEKGWRGIRCRERELNASTRQLGGIKQGTEADRDKSIKITHLIEGELKKHKEITKILGDRGKILDSQEEILHKREEILKNRRELIKKEKSELDETLNSFDEQKEKKLIELRNLTQEIEKNIKDFGQSKEKVETIRSEIFAVDNHKKQVDSELKQRIEFRGFLDKDIATGQEKLDELKQERLKIYEAIEKEISEKSKQFELFAEGKKALLQRIDEKEREVARKKEGLEIISEEIQKDRESLKVDSSLLAENKRKLEKQARELEIKEGNIEKQRQEAEAFLREAKILKEKKDKEIKKQELKTKELENKEAILSSQEEVLDKTREFLNRRERQLEKDQAKLADDRRSLNRAMVERR